MKRLSRFFLTVVALLIVFPLFGRGGTEETGYQPVDGIENWEHSFSIEDNKPGLYNIIIEGKDQAGNKAIGGPFNVRLDPESDKPVARISYPVPEMRIGTSLLVVGTCVDDDEVAKVEIQLDDNEWEPVEGTAFWTKSIDVEDIPDGQHLLRVRGTDLNGLVGMEHSVVFHLDKIKPFNQVSSHNSGVLTTGKIDLKGTVSDANGVASIQYSLDNGESYSSLKYKSSKDKTTADFSIDIDTRDFPDGPLIVWLESQDFTQSVGRAAFLIFIDNTDPQIEILSPLPEEAQNGKTAIMGRIFDEIGMKSLKVLWEKEEKEIPMRPGDPYFRTDLDFSAVKGKKTTVTFLFEDLAGNMVQHKQEILLDKAADLPLVTLFGIDEGSIVTSGDMVYGFLTDDDEAVALHYAFDKEETQKIETKDLFQFFLPALVPGEHSITYWAEDRFGTLGPSTQLRFQSQGDSGEFQFKKILSLDEEKLFRTGMALNRVEQPKLQGIISVSEVLKNGTYNYGRGDTPLKFSKIDEGYSFEVPLENAPYGIFNISVKAEDSWGRVHQDSIYLKMRNDNLRNEKWGLFFSPQEENKQGLIPLKEEGLQGYFHGSSIQSITLEPETSLVRIENTGPFIYLYPQAQGITPPLKVNVTTEEGHVFSSPVFTFSTDSVAPDLQVEIQSREKWVQEESPIAIEAKDGHSLSSIEYSLDHGKGWKTLWTESEGELENDLNWEGSLLFEDQPDGPLLILVRAIDASGNSTEIAKILRKDTTPPKGILISPAAGDSFSGSIHISGLWEEESSIKNLSYTLDGSTLR